MRSSSDRATEGKFLPWLQRHAVVHNIRNAAVQYKPFFIKTSTDYCFVTI